MPILTKSSVSKGVPSSFTVVNAGGEYNPAFTASGLIRSQFVRGQKLELIF
jgi:hypothetical protein